MTLTIHIPHWFGWALACAGCFIGGAATLYVLYRVVFVRAVGRMFGW